MRIALNLLYLLPGIVGGTETYAKGLLFALSRIESQHTFLVFTNQESRNWPLPNQHNFVRIECPISATNRTFRYLYEQLLLPKLLARMKTDLVHSLGYVGPTFVHCPSVVTVHDLNYRAFGQSMPRKKRLALGFLIKLSIMRANYVITVSEFSQNEIIEAFSVPRSKLGMIHSATDLSMGAHFPTQDAHTILESHSVRLPYILAFSSMSPNKNIVRLIEAFKRARDEGQLRHRLVLVGALPDDVSLSVKNNVSEVISSLGYVDTRTLQVFWANAQMLLFPSYYEGFGLPLLEAMAAGVPVACSNVASIPEVAGGAALFFDPFSVDQIKNCIIQLASKPELRTDLIEKGYINLERFSWDKTARATINVYEQVAASVRRKSNGS